jgi:hypothetical protein
MRVRRFFRDDFIVLVSPARRAAAEDANRA